MTTGSGDGRIAGPVDADRAGRGPSLRRTLRPHQFFTMGFGSVIGVAWVVVLGQWLDRAGPMGAILAFLGGGAVMMLVGLCYAEVGTAIPVAGGEVAYAHEVFGVKTAYAVGWLLALAYVAIVAFEAISVGWVLAALIPGSQGPAIYSVAGGPVPVGSLLIGVGGTLVLTYLNYRGVRGAAAFQDVSTYGLIILALVFILAGIAGGSTENLRPWFQESAGKLAWSGVLGVFAAAPLWFSGFNVIPQLMEERAADSSLGLLGRVMLLAIGAAAVFYMLVILAASMAAPWRELVGMDLPAATVFRSSFRSPLLANIVLAAALLGIVTTWNTAFIAGSRVLFAFGRARLIGPAFGAVHPRFGSPFKSVLFVGALGSAAACLGRSALIPIVNVGSTCLAFAYLLTCVSLIRLRRRRPELPRPYRVPGGVWVAAAAIVGALYMLLTTLYQPLVDARGQLPLEWVVLGVWILLGLVFWISARKRRNEVSGAERARLMLGMSEPS